MPSAHASIALLLACSALACDKDEARTGPATPASAAAQTSAAAITPLSPAEASAPTPSASAAVAGPRCPPGLTGNATPAFCMKLPAGYAVKDARTSPTRGSIAYDTGNQTDVLMVSYDAAPLSDQAKDVESELKFGGDKLEKKGDLPGGGKWYLGTHADFEHLVTLVKGTPPITLKCSFAYKPKSPPSKEAIEACRTLALP